MDSRQLTALLYMVVTGSNAYTCGSLSWTCATWQSHSSIHMPWLTTQKAQSANLDNWSW